MKLKWIIALAAMLAVSASADTIFLGGSVTNTASWDNGLPTSVGNPGIIGVNGSIPGGTLTGYYVTQTNGTVNNESFTGTAHTDGEWNVNGGTYTTRAMTLGGTHVFNVDGGTAKLGNNNRDVVLSGTSSLNVISGAIDFGRRLILNGGSFTMSGGTLTGDTDTWLGANSFNGGGLMNFNGGTATFAQLNFGDASTKAVFGGSSAGSVTIDSFLGTNMDIDWLTGTKMALSVTNVTDWAETLWNSGQLTYNGQGIDELSNAWFEVTAEDGLEEGVRFNYNSGTKTLSLDGGAPPSSYDNWAAGFGVGAGTNDFDSDGVNNLYEYGFDGNPTNALDQGTLPTFTKSESSFIYVYPLRSDDMTILYTVETTTDLVNGVWTNTGYTVTGTNVTGETLNFVTNEVDAVDSEKFIRIKIEQR